MATVTEDVVRIKLNFKLIFFLMGYVPIPLPLGATHGRLSVVYALVVGNLNLSDLNLSPGWVGNLNQLSSLSSRKHVF